ncbi:hypothetical protein IWW45_001162 [Coemansia sp. RSA 485]|nr:hypothetical protein IWW45_001162 [Coemansia sp. RSA 485]
MGALVTILCPAPRPQSTESAQSHPPTQSSNSARLSARQCNALFSPTLRFRFSRAQRGPDAQLVPAGPAQSWREGEGGSRPRLETRGPETRRSSSSSSWLQSQLQLSFQPPLSPAPSGPITAQPGAGAQESRRGRAL